MTRSSRPWCRSTSHATGQSARWADAQALESASRSAPSPSKAESFRHLERAPKTDDALDFIEPERVVCRVTAGVRDLGVARDLTIAGLACVRLRSLDKRPANPLAAERHVDVPAL